MEYYSKKGLSNGLPTTDQDIKYRYLASLLLVIVANSVRVSNEINCLLINKLH